MGHTKVIDLSLPIRNFAMESQEQSISRFNHTERARGFTKRYGLRIDDFLSPPFLASETVTAATHAATHMDAPWHFGPTSEGRPSKTIDQIPLEWCYGDGVVLDFTHKKAEEWIREDDTKDALKAIGYNIKPHDIVLFRTDAYKHFDDTDFEMIHPGVHRSSVLWLIERGVRVMGIDSWGFDAPIAMMAEEYKRGNRENFFSAHFVGREKEYVHIEKLANLDKIPKPYGFKVAAFPVKIEGGSGGWVRAVAIIE